MKATSQRTYSRKRKETAESKFDALFSTNPSKISAEENDIKKRKTVVSSSQARPVTYDVSKVPNGSKRITVSTTVGSPHPTAIARKESASDKFDAIFNGPTVVGHGKLYTSTVKTSTPSLKKNVEVINEKKRIPYASHETKYDALFKKNEKSASDKFDALFGSCVATGTVSETAIDNRHKSDTYYESSNSEPDFKNLFGFVADEKSPYQAKSCSPKVPTELDVSRIKRALPTKHHITAATMETIGGKVVLNIQRGGRNTTRHASSAKLDNITVSSTAFVTDTKNVYQDKMEFSEENNFDLSSTLLTPTKEISQANLASNTATWSFKPEESSSKSAENVYRRVFNASVPKVSSQNDVKVSDLRHSPQKREHQQSLKNLPKKHSRVGLASGRQLSNVKPSYNSRPWIPDSEESSSVELFSHDVESQSLSQPSVKSADIAEKVPKLTRSVTWPENVGESIVTSLKCNKNVKAYYTVVKHVKNYQNCLEEGEAKEFEDEVEYLLEGLQPSQPIPIRCLSATNLSSKCQQHNFRLYLRAHNVSMKVFSNLQDATENKSLALATSALLFMLSRDRQMEVDKLTLQLLLRILDPLEKDNASANGQSKTGMTPKAPEVKKYKFFKSKGKAESDDNKNVAAVESKIKEMIDNCGDALLSGNEATTKRLASEALLRFTARRTTEWFREEIRIKGGLDHIILLVKSNVDDVTSSSSLTDRCELSLSLLERIMKVLENAIVNSPRNAMYLVTHQRAVLLKKIAALLHKCQGWLSLNPCWREESLEIENKSYTALRNCILQIVKLLVNISNDNEWVSTRVGDQDEMLANIVACVLVTPEQLKEAHRYELVLLSLSLLVNLVEASAKNRMGLVRMTVPSRKCDQSADNVTSDSTLVVKALVELFFARESAARDNEVLGEEGVKKAVEARKNVAGIKDSDAESLAGSQRSNFGGNDRDGRWVESEDGMEWVPSENANNQTIEGSQESVRSNKRNPEAGLTAEQKSEMKETLNKANEHMEHSIVAAYAALVLGCLIHGNRANVSSIRQHLDGDEGFKPMIKMLKKFLTFMKLTAGMSQKGERTLTQIIEDLEEESGA